MTKDYSNTSITYLSIILYAKLFLSLDPADTKKLPSPTIISFTKTRYSLSIFYLLFDKSPLYSNNFCYNYFSFIRVNSRHHTPSSSNISSTYNFNSHAFPSCQRDTVSSTTHPIKVHARKIEKQSGYTTILRLLIISPLNVRSRNSQMSYITVHL